MIDSFRPLLTEYFVFYAGLKLLGLSLREAVPLTAGFWTKAK